MNKIKKFLRKNWWVIVGILIGGTIILNYNSKDEVTPVVDSTPKQEVTNRPTAETILFGSWTPTGARAIVGTTDSESDIDVNAELNGKISRVNVDMGDTVRAGQALATFDIQGDQTYVNYQNALNSLESTKSSSAASVEAARLGVINAEKEYQQLLLQLQQNKKATLEGLRNTILSTSTTGLNVLNYFDGQIGASLKYKDHFAIGRGYIGVTNQILKIKVQNDIRAQRMVLEDLKTKTIPNEEQALINLANKHLAFLNQLKLIAGNYNTLIQGTTVTADFSNTTKQQVVAQTEGQNSQTIQAITQLNTQIQAVKNTDEQQKNQILAAQNRIESAQASLELSQSQSEGQVKSAQNGVNLAASQKSDLVVRAPFSGKITEKFVRPGQFVAPGLKLFSMINLNQEKRVISYLSINEIKRLKNQEVIKIEYEDRIIETDNFIEGLTINPQTQKIKVDFILPEDEDVVPGKTVKVLLSSEGETNLIPLSAISFEPNGTQEVFIVNEEGTLERRTVTVKNDLADGVFITSGIESGDQVIVYKNRFYSGQTVQIAGNNN